MGPIARWVTGFLVIAVAATAAAAVLAWRAGYLNGVSMHRQAAADEVAYEGRIIVQLHAQIQNPREVARSHRCDFSATIVNRTRNHLLAGHLALGGRSIDLPEIAANHNAEVFVWTINVPQDQATCAAKARWYQKIAHEAKPVSCTMSDVAPDRCRRLVRVVGDFDYPQLQADDWEAAHAAAAAADALRQANLPAGTTVEIPPASFFKLGFDRGDAQTSDAARALASGQQPFDPDRPADVERLYLWSEYATMDGPVTILNVHQDHDQVADWYKVSLWADPDGAPRYQVIAWVARDDLDKAMARNAALPRVSN